MIEFHKSHRHLTAIGDGSDYTGIRLMHIQNNLIRKWIAEVMVNLIGEIRKISDQVVFPEMVGINEWPIGGVQAPHLDTYSNQQMNLLENGLVFFISMIILRVVELIYQTEKYTNQKQVQAFYFKASTFHMVLRKLEDTHDIQSQCGSPQTSIEPCLYIQSMT
jgi:hypothetical protein